MPTQNWIWIIAWTMLHLCKGVPLTICIDQTHRALVIVLPSYGALEIVGVIIIIIIIKIFHENNPLKFDGTITI